MEYRGDLQSELTILTNDFESENIQLPIYAGFISGKILNPSQVTNTYVQFYSSLKEVRTITIPPNSKLEFDALQCDRIIFKYDSGKYKFSAYSYIIQLMNATNSQDNNESFWRSNIRLTGLQYSELEPYLRTVKVNIDSGKQGQLLERDFNVPYNSECGVAYAYFAPDLNNISENIPANQEWRFSIQREDANKSLVYPVICCYGNTSNGVYPPIIPENSNLIKINSTIGSETNTEKFDIKLVPGTNDAHIIALRVLELPRGSTFISGVM